MPAAVVAILDDDTRRDRVTLHLNETALFTFLKTLPKSQGFDQPQMIRLLRTTLANSVGKQEILAAVRKVKFRQLASGETSIQHGNESMGQQIENEVTGAADIPDTLVVDTPIYSPTTSESETIRWFRFHWMLKSCRPNAKVRHA